MARRIILIVIALLISGGAIFLAQQWLRGGQKNPRPVAGSPHVDTSGTTQVLVAHNDLYAGQFIRPEYLTWQAWPAGPLPDSYLVEGKARPQDLVGSVVRSRIAKGQPIALGQIVRPGERGFMAAVLDTGERAVTVNVTPSSGVAGFILPGDRVDVILTMSLQPISGQTGATRHVAETLLRNVRVVGMDQSFTDGKKDDKADLTIAKTATLEVSPKQAEILAVSSDIGVLSMSLRSVANEEKDEPAGPLTKTWDTDATQISLAAKPVTASPSARPSNPAGSPRWTVEIVRGGGATDAAPAAPPPSFPAPAPRGGPTP
jgi:pilus assembly protein CpaB